MSLIEYLFQIERCSGEVTASYEVCDFWSIDDQGDYYFFTSKPDFADGIADSFTELLCGFEFYAEDMLFVDWQELQPLFDIRISDDSEFPGHEPLMRNQVIAIRGTCSGQCAKSIRPYNGYVTRLIPSCEPVRQITRDGDALNDAGWNGMDFKICNLKANKNVRIGTAVCSHKNADFTDMLRDAAYWASCCKCVDAVIFNLDSYLDMTDSDTAGAYAAIHIKNGQLRIVTGEALKKLYRQYCKYPAIDYELEKSISCLLNQYFKFER